MQTNAIDLTPTWSGLLPVLIQLASSGTTAESRIMATEELEKMARLADKYVEIVKAN